MKTAFAYWDDRIAPVFDTVRDVLIVESDGSQIVGRTPESFPESLPVQKALRLMELGVTTLVCGAISRPMHELIMAYGIRVIPFIAGDLPDVIQGWLSGVLERDSFAMPGCCRRRRQGSGGSDDIQEVNMMNNLERGMGAGGGRGAGGGSGRGAGAGGGRGQAQGGGARGQGQGRGRMGGPLAAGPSGSCVCPKCGHIESHQRGLPCVERQCSKCGTAMMRE